MRAEDWEVPMPSNEDWTLTDSTTCEAWWAQDPCDLLIALEDEDEDVGTDGD